MRWFLKRGWMYGAMIAVSAFALFPVYWVVITSLKPRSEIYTRTPDLWPSDPQWDQYPRVLGEGHVGRALMNSLIVASGTMVLCLLVSASRNSFQPSRKLSTAVTASPGAASGSTTRHMAPIRVAPSIRAACSSSSGIDSTNPRITQIANGTLNAR